MKKLVWLVVAVVVVVVLYGAGDALVDMGVFRTVSSQQPDGCRAVSGMPGTEDITIHPDGAHAYISSNDRRAGQRGESRPGAIYRYDLETGESEALELPAEIAADFHPHGIDLYVGPDGETTVLFVVNHPGGSRFHSTDREGPKHTVEVFDVEDGGLGHRETVAGAELVSPNDVVGVAPGRFYVTNDHGAEPGLWRTLEEYLRLPWANVAYYDGDELREAADGLVFANGINVSPDGRTLYVAQTTANSVQRYERNPDSGELTPGEAFDAGFGVDNIEIDADGALWIGGHPKLLAFLEHARNPEVRAPSRVVRAEFYPDGTPNVQTVFENDGSLIAGSSVGAKRGRHLLVGAVFDDRIVHCRLPE